MMSENHRLTPSAHSGLNQYRSWTPSVINYDDDIGGTWGSPGAANGVLMQDGWITAGFNALNQPMYIWSSTVGWMNFGYDPLGRCVKRWNDSGVTTYLYYDGWNLIQEGPASGGTIWDGWSQTLGGVGGANLVYLNGARVDEIVFSVDFRTMAQAFFQYDGTGNCSVLTDWSGNIMEQYDYDAFGQPYFYDATGTTTYLNGQPGSPFGNRFLFTGREWLGDLKLYDYRNRMYQPELGRFLQPDPKQFAAGDYNLYRYCHNDPVNKNDPTGLRPPELEYGADKAQDAQSQQNALRAVPGLKDTYKTIDESPIRNVIKDAQSKDNPARPGKNRLKLNYTDSGDSLFDRIRNWLTGRERTITSYVDPHNRETATGKVRAPIFGAANELGEMYEANRGTWGQGGDVAHDNRTIDVENIARGYWGVPHRPHNTNTVWVQ